MAHRSWFPEALTGTNIVLRRHVPANIRAFQRWYADPDVVRLTRYQDGPMRPDEIERFFAARALGADSLAMAIHVRADDRLIGTCALSQMDSDNGSALFHITIGEKDTWGRGYGTAATQLMIDHAFGALGLHRIGLTVFSFNERAIRADRAVPALAPRRHAARIRPARRRPRRGRRVDGRESRAGPARRSGGTAGGGTRSR